MINTDVLIVGGGPAGSTCAWQLNKAGYDCLILDKARFPRQKPCAGWITPAVFRYLEISPEEYPHSLTKLTSFQISVWGIRFRLPTNQYAIRRIEFDNWLLKRSGVKYLHHQVERIEEKNGCYTIDDAYQAKFLVAAGGTHCPVKKRFFHQGKRSRNQGLILAKEEEFLYPVKDQDCHLWFFENGLPGYAWYVPKSGGYLNVGIGASVNGLKKQGKTLEQYWQSFIQKLEVFGLIEKRDCKPLGYSYYRRHHDTECYKDNIFLIGDALGVATRDMAEGISPAVQSGLLAGNAILAQNDYSIQSIPKYSFPYILGIRK